MTVRATNNALGDFLPERLERSRAAHEVAHGGTFRSAYMIEFQNADIGFAAVHAGMLQQIIGDEKAISFAVFRLEGLPLLLQDLRTMVVTRFIVLVLT